MRHAGWRRCLDRALVVLIGLPFALLVMLSLARSWRYPALWPSAWQFDQWRAVGAAWPALVTTVLRSALLAISVGLLATAAGFLTSRVIAARRNTRAWLALGVLPFAISPVVYALCLGQAFAWLDLSGHMLGVLLAQLPFAYANAVLLCHGYWTRHSRELGELAHALGASDTQLWWRVHLPLARGLLGMCLFQTALMSWFDFALVRVIGAGRVQTLTLAVFDYFGSGDLRLAATASVLLILPPVLALLLDPRLLLPAPAWSSAR